MFKASLQGGAEVDGLDLVSGWEKRLEFLE
jgi:hypothetical protein